MNELALFCGVLGGGLGSRLLDTQVVCAVENEPYCIEVLLRRMEDGSLPSFPVWDDIKTFDGEPFRGVVDIISAGFPCQPWSVAGPRKGTEDERNLWPDTCRVIGEVRPGRLLLENVPGIVGYLPTVFRDLALLGYDAKSGTISAAEAGAPHTRNRWWCMAHSNDNAETERGECQVATKAGSSRNAR